MTHSATDQTTIVGNWAVQDNSPDLSIVEIVHPPAGGRGRVKVEATFGDLSPVAFRINGGDIHLFFYIDALIRNQSGTDFGTFRVSLVNINEPAPATTLHPPFAHFHDSNFPGSTWDNPSLPPYTTVLGYNNTTGILGNINQGANELWAYGGTLAAGSARTWTDIGAHQSPTSAGGGSFYVVLTPNFWPVHSRIMPSYQNVYEDVSSSNYYGGTARNDLVFGYAGDDVIYGAAGDDVLVGGEGKDNLFGGTGADWLIGGDGDDNLYGEDGDDVLIGGRGNDFHDGGTGQDIVVYSGIRSDYKIQLLTGGTLKVVDLRENSPEGRDTLQHVEFFKFADSLIRTEDLVLDEDDPGPPNIINGTNKADVLKGTSGVDHIFGGNGKDVLCGGDGDDLLNGGNGNDYLTGAAGADIFAFGKGGGKDVITDFNKDEGDRLQLLDGMTVKRIRAVDTDKDGSLDATELQFTGASVILLNVTGLTSLEGLLLA